VLPDTSGQMVENKGETVKKLLSWYLINIITLRYAIENDMRFSIAGVVIYEPRDFSYWGA
jgi:hypothetical protein